MKVLMLTSSFPRYEGDYFGPWVLEYCREMVRQGHELTLVAPSVGKMNLTHLSEKNLTIHRFNYFYPLNLQKLVYPPGIIPQLKKNKLRFFQIPFLIIAYYWQVRKILKAQSFDILHSQWVIPSGFIGTLIAKRYNIPHLITSQGAEFFLAPKHPFSWFTKWVLKRCDYLLPVSRQMGVRAIQFGMKASKIKVVPNTVNTKQFHPNANSNFRIKNKINETTPIILTVRRLVFEKRVEDVLQAFALLNHDSARLVIAGDGPDREKLEELCIKLGIQNKVLFLGFVDNKQLPSLYSASDLYIISSQQEGLSLSLLESMASGLITISTSSTGGNEVIENGENGFLYEVGNINQLYKKMDTAIKMYPEERQRIKIKARQRIIDEFSVVKMVKSWETIYKELCL